jgi:hypothetical protein
MPSLAVGRGMFFLLARLETVQLQVSDFEGLTLTCPPFSLYRVRYLSYNESQLITDWNGSSARPFPHVSESPVPSKIIQDSQLT